ncbi:MAG: DUF58 domain-containing protein [Firmicutes bacterium]|nr:DUF58 domain-containing protein [Bacillota bacterium]
MGITKNYVYLTAFGIVFTLTAWPFGFHGFIFLFWNLLIMGLLVLDVFITPSPKHLIVRRADELKLYFKTENTVTFYVKNTYRQGLKIEGKDERLRHFNVVGQDMSHFIEPGKEQVFSYKVIPAKRGSFGSNKVYLRYAGLMGLCKKYVTVPCPATYKVYPNVKDLSKYRLMMQKSRLLPTGDKSLRQYGAGLDFESLRTYVEGDDYRKINWAATARENKLMVNQYQIERDQPVYILLDIGRPMSYTVNGFKKLDYSINAALILSDIVNQQGDKAGLMVFDSKVQAHISPGQGALHRNTLMETLYNVADNRQTADYEGAFRTLCEQQKRRSLVFIFTDFEILEEAEDLIAHIAILKRRHIPIVVFMENESLTAMADAPDSAKIYDKMLKLTAQEFHNERRQIIRKLNMMGIPSVESTAEQFTVSAVNRYLQARRS